MRTRSFHDVAHARSYLTGSIIRVEDEPVMVADVNGRRSDLILSYYPLKDANKGIEYSNIRIDDEDVNMEPVPLGFSWTDDQNIIPYNMNHTLTVFRVPVRTWKVGLYRKNCGTINALSREGREWKNSWIPSPMLRNTIVGEYPDLEEAITRVQNKQGTVPFSRRFAVCGSALVYKTFLEPVGHINEKTHEPVLNERFSFLKEVLAEDLK